MKTTVAALVAYLLGAGVAAQAPKDPPQRPQFRSAVNLVRIDVYPTLEGRGVAGLKAEDFEVLEDGVPQKVATFEHVAVRAAGPGASRVEPRTLGDANQMAADPRNRLFVLFLDTFHVTDEVSTGDGFGWARARGRGREKPLGPAPIDKGLVTFFDRLVGPDDMFAIMRPEMDARDLTFARRTGPLEDLLASVWSRRTSGDWLTDDLDPDEERWYACYPPDDPLNRYAGVAGEMVARRREQSTIRALHSLIDRLWDLREERKAVLLVSEGWYLFRPNPKLARVLEGIPNAGPPGVYVGPGGKLTLGTDPRMVAGSADIQQCNRDRLNLSVIDNEKEFRAVPDHANRANVTFYTVDPHGLNVGRGYEETLKTLAGATDGVAIMTNDFTAGLKRIADDLSDYYLIGYYSTNSAFDGRFRRITVRVRRPGVAVRARPGYRALTEAEARVRPVADDPPGPAPGPEPAARQAALLGLERLRISHLVHVQAAWGWRDRTAVPEALLSMVVELDTGAVRRTEPPEDSVVRASVYATDGRAVAAGSAHVSPSSRTAVIRFADAALAPGEYVARVAGQVAGQAVAEQVPVTIPAGPGSFGLPLVYRRGPYTGTAFQPTADARFRRGERLRADVVVSASTDTVTARVLDQRGQPLAVPVPVSLREDEGGRVAAAELSLAPLAPGDYLLELTAAAGGSQQKAFVAFRVIP